MSTSTRKNNNREAVMTQKIIRLGNLSTSYSAVINDMKDKSSDVPPSVRKRHRQIKKKLKDMNAKFRKEFRTEESVAK